MEKSNDEKQIISYLLGDLGEDEQRRVEEQLLTNDEYFDLLLVAEDDLIDDYVRSTLSGRERERFEAYFLSTPERRARVRFAIALKDRVAAEPAPPPPTPVPRPAWWKQLFSVPSLGFAAAVIILLALGVGTWRAFFYESELSKGLVALNKAYSAERPVEARISKFDYAPFPVTRGDEQRAVDKLSLKRAEGKIADEAEQTPNAASLHALGKLYLTEKKFDEAIEQFEKALKIDDKNAHLHSDLGAAWLEKGKIDNPNDQGEKNLEAFAQSLEHLNRALELDGSLLEALFNRGLCHQYMFLPHQAEQDWRAYIDKDPNSKWAEEARRNLQQLEEQKQKVSQNKEQLFQEFLNAYRAGNDDRAWTIVSQNKEAMSGKSIMEQLLGAYLNSSLGGQSEEAENMLQALSYLGTLESQRGGDSYMSGVVQYVRSSSQKQLALLDQAYKLIATGKSSYLQAKNNEAINAYDRAKQIFVRIGDESEALLTDYYIAYSYPDKADIKHSKSMYEQLAQTFEKRNFKWLLMRVYLGLSVVNFSLNNYSKAIKFASQSLELAKQMNDANGTLNAWSCLIEYYRYIGSYSQALYCVQQSLPFIDPGSLGLVQIWRHYAIIASAFNSAGFYSAAIDCQREALDLARKTDNPVTLCVSYAHLGLMYGKAGNYSEAIKNIELAHETARSCSDEGVGKNQMAYAALQMGHLHRQMEDFARALESYDESIETYKSLQFPTFLYQAHKGKLICYIAQQNASLASQEIKITLDMIEMYRSKILEAENRNNFFDIEQSIYDLAADFEYSRMNNREKAFEYSEESRARSLLDSMSTETHVSAKGNVPEIDFQNVSTPLSLATIQQRMPGESQILQYAVLTNKILVWLVSKNDFSAYELIINQNELNEKVSDYLKLISSAAETNKDDASRRAKELFDVVISRVEQKLDKKKLLCVVPDKILNSLSFASLISTNTNEYLVKDYAIIYSPSASVFVICSEEAQKKAGGSVERVLSVGNPRFDRNEFASLPDLPSAGAEAESVAACYELSRRLIGIEARKSVIESEMKESEVVHFALHSVPGEVSPMRSKLVLAKESKSTSSDEDSKGVLESYEIYKLRLPRTRLVVLSACRTGVDRYYKGEGMLSMARSFIVARVPLTVASLWEVDSASTKELMIRFHKHRKVDNSSTAEALKRAQLDMLASSDSSYRLPYHWASFVAIGGQTSF